MSRPVAWSIALAVLLAGCGEPPVVTTAGRMERATRDVMQATDLPALSKLGTWTRLVQAAGLVDDLSAPEGPYTVFAPVDDAFAALPPRTMEALLDPGQKEQLRAVLLRHVHVGGALVVADVRQPTTISTGDGGQIQLPLAVENNVLTVGTAKAIRTDVVCTNGVIHTIDRVLVP